MWRVTLPGRPPSWNDSYRIVQKVSHRDGRRHVYHTMAKTQGLNNWQEGMVLVVRSAMPSRWTPGERFIPILWGVYLERHIDMDNLQKAVNDVIEMATGVNDKWFYPIFLEPTIGVRRKDARIELTIDHDGDGGSASRGHVYPGSVRQPLPATAPRQPPLPAP